VKSSYWTKPVIGVSMRITLERYKKRVIEMKKWSNKIKRVITQEEGGGRKNINLAIVSANNHYAGFGP
jgi:hypothetical protein